MNRDKHIFQFTGAAISDAARVGYDYHKARVEFWRQEHEKAVAAAKEKGVEVREYAVTGGKRAQVVLDPTLSERITECTNKISTHQMAADKFQVEAAAYGTQKERVYDLHPDDVLYFRLAGGERDA